MFWVFDKTDCTCFVCNYINSLSENHHDTGFQVFFRKNQWFFRPKIDQFCILSIKVSVFDIYHNFFFYNFIFLNFFL